MKLIVTIIVTGVLVACGGGGDGAGGDGSLPPANGGGGNGPVVVPGPQWGVAELLEATAGKAVTPQVAIDAAGNGVAVWVQTPEGGGTVADVWSRRYTPAGGWGEAELVEEGTGAASNPQVVMGPNGEAMVVWVQAPDGGGTVTDVWSRRYTPAGDAELAQKVQFLGGIAGAADSPRVAMDPNGQTMVVWRQTGAGQQSDIWARRYTSSGIADEPVQIDGSLIRSGFDPQVAWDAQGNAIAVWRHFAEKPDIIFANRFSGGNWAVEPESLEAPTNVGRTMGAPRLAMNARGEAVAVWMRVIDGTVSLRTDIRANRFVPATDAAPAAWGEAVLVESNDAGPASFPQVAIDDAGRAMAVWVQALGVDATARSEVWSARQLAAGDWGGVARVDEGDVGTALGVSIAMVPEGDALLAWTGSDVAPFEPGEFFSVRARTYSAATGFSKVEAVEAPTPGLSNAPALAMNADGKALATWDRFDLLTGQQADVLVNALR